MLQIPSIDLYMILPEVYDYSYVLSDIGKYEVASITEYILQGSLRVLTSFSTLSIRDVSITNPFADLQYILFDYDVSSPDYIGVCMGNTININDFTNVDVQYANIFSDYTRLITTFVDNDLPFPMNGNIVFEQSLSDIRKGELSHPFFQASRGPIFSQNKRTILFNSHMFDSLLNDVSFDLIYNTFTYPSLGNLTINISYDVNGNNSDTISILELDDASNIESINIGHVPLYITTHNVLPHYYANVNYIDGSVITKNSIGFEIDTSYRLHANTRFLLNRPDYNNNINLLSSTFFVTMPVNIQDVDKMFTDKTLSDNWLTGNGTSYMTRTSLQYLSLYISDINILDIALPIYDTIDESSFYYNPTGTNTHLNASNIAVTNIDELSDRMYRYALITEHDIYENKSTNRMELHQIPTKRNRTLTPIETIYPFIALGSVGIGIGNVAYSIEIPNESCYVYSNYANIDHVYILSFVTESPAHIFEPNVDFSLLTDSNIQNFIETNLDSLTQGYNTIGSSSNMVYYDGSISRYDLHNVGHIQLNGAFNTLDILASSDFVTSQFSNMHKIRTFIVVYDEHGSCSIKYIDSIYNISRVSTFTEGYTNKPSYSVTITDFKHLTIDNVNETWYISANLSGVYEQYLWTLDVNQHVELISVGLINDNRFDSSINESFVAFGYFKTDINTLPITDVHTIIFAFKKYDKTTQTFTGEQLTHIVYFEYINYNIRNTNRPQFSNWVANPTTYSFDCIVDYTFDSDDSTITYITDLIVFHGDNVYINTINTFNNTITHSNDMTFFGTYIRYRTSITAYVDYVYIGESVLVSTSIPNS